MQLIETEYRDLATSNKLLAQSLRTLHDPKLDLQALRIEHCVHSLTRPDDTSHYCWSSLCLECRRWKALEERRVLRRQLDRALSGENPPLMFFQTLTLQDCTPAQIASRAGLLVEGFKKLRRKLPYCQGWARVIETKTAEFDPEGENVHLHFVILFPPGQEEKVRSIDWHALWSECAGSLARSTDPDADFARVPYDVLTYMTKALDWQYAQDGNLGAVDVRRYVQRVMNGHSKFGNGGLLRLKLSDTCDGSELSKFLAWITPPSTAMSQARRDKPFLAIPIECGA